MKGRKGGDALETLGELVLVANLDVVDLPGIRMAVGDAQGAVGGAGVAKHVLELVKGVVDEGLQVRLGDAGVVERVARVDGQDGLGVEILAPVEDLCESEAVGVDVGPGAEAAGAVDEGADGVAPLPAVGKGVALEIVAAGDPQEAGVQLGEGVHEVDAHAVGPVVPGRGHQADELELQGARGGGGRVKGDGEGVV